MTFRETNIIHQNLWFSFCIKSLSRQAQRLLYYYQVNYLFHFHLWNSLKKEHFGKLEFIIDNSALFQFKV